MADADKGKAPQVEAPQLDEQATTSQAQEQAQPQPDLEHNPDFQKETEGNAPSEASSEDAPALEPVEQTGETSQSAQQQEPEQGQEEGKEQEPAQPEAQEAAKEDDKPEYIKSQPRLEQFFQSLPSILEKSGHNEMWGVTLSDWHHIPTVNVLVKYIRANDGNLDLAKEQLLKALKWRKSMSPLSLVDEVYATKFQGLGYLTKYKTSSGQEEVFSWNIYGSVAKNIKETFGDAEAFIKWRVALMEMATAELKMNEATTVIPMEGEDPYRMIQVHDYSGVSFLRMDPKLRTATKQIIDVFSTAYPELLKEKYFVNVPMIMGWMFTAIKVFLSKNTVRKMHPITNGANLAREFSYGKELPSTYGGSGPELKGSAAGPKIEGEASAEPSKTTPAAETATATETAPEPQPEATPQAEPQAETATEDAKPAEPEPAAEAAAESKPAETSQQEGEAMGETSTANKQEEAH